MYRSRLSLSACSAGLFLMALLCSAGCGGKDASSATNGGVASTPAAQLPAENRSAMETQQKTDAAERAAHTKRP